MAEPLAVLPQEYALQMIGLVAAGVPNEERVVLRATVAVDLGAYFLVTGWRLTPDRALPMNQESFWLGKTIVPAGQWVLVYTGQGQQTLTYLGGDPCLVLHWGKTYTLFNKPEIVPVVIHIDSVAVGKRL